MSSDRPLNTTREPLLTMDAVEAGEPMDGMREAKKQSYSCLSRRQIMLMWSKVKKPKDPVLLLYMVGIIIAATVNRVAFRLMLYPMFNFQYFLSNLTTFVFVPVFFGAVWARRRTGAITDEMIKFPKWKMCVMGTLDSVAGLFMIFGGAHISGTMTVLLSQAAIPVTMVASMLFLKVRYQLLQYGGAGVIFGGILLALVPKVVEKGAGHLVWNVVFFCSAIPTALSSVYKEIAFRAQEMDVWYLNAWVALPQLLFGMAVAPIVAPVSGVPVHDIPINTKRGGECWLLGKDWYPSDCSDASNLDADKCTADCSQALAYVLTYMIANLCYNVLVVLVVKHGSAALMFIAQTVVIPLSNICFTMSFIMGKHAQSLSLYDIFALLVIIGGLVLYRVVPERPEKGPDEEEIMVYSGMSTVDLTRTIVVKKAHIRPKTVAQVRSSYFARLGLTPGSAPPGQ